MGPLALVCALSAGLQPPSAEALERLALAARTGIRTLTATAVEVQRNDNEVVTLRFKLWRDGDKGRADVVRSDGLLAGVRVVECRNCGDPGSGIEYVELLRHSSKLFKMRDDQPPHLTSAADWRVIGYYPNIWGFAQEKPLDVVVGSTDRGPVRVDRRPLDGADCWVLSYKSKRHGEIECWIDPTRGHNVVRLRQTIPVNDVPVYSQIESDVRAVPGGAWFPAKVRVTRGSGDKPGVEIEAIEFTDVRVNEQIPPATFTLAGFGVAEGTTFSGPKPGQGREWRNGKLGPLTGKVPAGAISAAPPVPVDPSTQRAFNPWLLAVCGVSAIAAAGVALRARRG